MDTTSERLKAPCSKDCQRRTATCHGDKEYCPEYYEYWCKKQKMIKKLRKEAIIDRYQARNAAIHMIRKEKEKKAKRY